MTSAADRATAPSCWRGRFAGARITGVDTSESMLEHARTRAPAVRFVKQDIADWTPDGRPGPHFHQRRAAVPSGPPRAFPATGLDARPRRRVCGADAVGRARIVSCADADGRRRGSVVVAAGAGRQVAAADRRLRGLLRMAAARVRPHRVVDHDLCLRIRRSGRHRRLVRRFAAAAVPGTALRRRAMRIPRPLSQGAAERLSRAVGRTRCCSPTRAFSSWPREGEARRS